MKEATKEQDLIEGCNVLNYQSVCHMAFTKHHLSKSTGVLECPGKPLHGKTFCHESKTPKYSFGNWGNPSHIFYLPEPKSPEFNTLELLIKHYNN